MLDDYCHPHPSGKESILLARAVEPVVFQVFLAGEGLEEAVTPLWEVGGSRSLWERNPPYSQYTLFFICCPLEGKTKYREQESRELYTIQFSLKTFLLSAVFNFSFSKDRTEMSLG